MDTEDSEETLDTWADVIVLQYPHQNLHRQYAERAMSQGRPKIVVEMDDNPYCISPFNLIGYPYFGT